MDPQYVFLQFSQMYFSDNKSLSFDATRGTAKAGPDVPGPQVRWWPEQEYHSIWATVSLNLGGNKRL